MLKQIFEGASLQETTACVWHGNPACERVLIKNGFRLVGECEDFCQARGVRLKNNSFKLTVRFGCSGGLEPARAMLYRKINH